MKEKIIPLLLYLSLSNAVKIWGPGLDGLRNEFYVTVWQRSLNLNKVTLFKMVGQEFDWDITVF